MSLYRYLSIDVNEVRLAYSGQGSSRRIEPHFVRSEICMLIRFESATLCNPMLPNQRRLLAEGWICPRPACIWGFRSLFSLEDAVSWPARLGWREANFRIGGRSRCSQFLAIHSDSDGAQLPGDWVYVSADIYGVGRRWIGAAPARASCAPARAPGAAASSTAGVQRQECEQCCAHHEETPARPEPEPSQREQNREGQVAAEWQLRFTRSGINPCADRQRGLRGPGCDLHRGRAERAGDR